MPQVTLDLPQEVWERASDQARGARKPVEELLRTQLELDFAPDAQVEGKGATASAWEAMDFSGLTDEQLLVHIHAMLPDDLQKRLTELQARNNEGELQPDEVEAFDRLLRIVHTGTLLKSHALLAWERRYGALPQGFGRASAS